MLCDNCGAKTIKEKAVAPLKYKNGTQVRRGDHFAIDYEGIVVDTFAEGSPHSGTQTWVLVYWIPIQPDKGSAIKTNHVWSEREWAAIQADSDSVDPAQKHNQSLQRLDAEHFTAHAVKK